MTMRANILKQHKPKTSLFPLTIDGSGRFFRDSQLNPFFISGIAAWNIHTQLSDSDQAFFLDDCVSKGMNAIMVMLLDHFYTSHVPTDFHGNAPFSSAGDFSTPVTAYFTNFKRVLQLCLDRNILMVLAPMYAGYEGTTPKQGWADEMRSNGSTKLRAFGQYVEGQLASFPNLIYQHLGDNTADLKDLAYAMAQGLNDVTPGRLQTAHCNGGGGGPDHSPRDVFTPAGSYSIINTNLIYTYADYGSGNYIADLFISQWTRSPAWPTYFAEDRYLDDGVADAYITRWQTYQAILSGACGKFIGINGIWYFDGVGNAGPPQGWKLQLGAAGYAHMRIAITLLLNYAWSASTPDTGNAFLTSGFSSGNNRAVAQLANDGTFALAYTPINQALTFNMAKLSKTVNVSWVDPTTGTKTFIESRANSGSKSYTPSGNNAGGQADWTLVFE